MIDSVSFNPPKWNVMDNDFYLQNSVSLKELSLDYIAFMMDYLSDRITLKVTAYDANYYDYQRSKNSLTELTGYRLQLLEGGVGVFGSVNSDSLDISIKRPGHGAIEKLRGDKFRKRFWIQPL